MIVVIWAQQNQSQYDTMEKQLGLDSILEQLSLTFVGFSGKHHMYQPKLKCMMYVAYCMMCVSLTSSLTSFIIPGQMNLSLIRATVFLIPRCP